MKQKNRLNDVADKVYAGLSPRERIKQITIFEADGKPADARQVVNQAPRDLYRCASPEMMQLTRDAAAIHREINRLISGAQEQLRLLDLQREDLKRREFVSSLMRGEPRELLEEDGTDRKYRTLRAARIRGAHQEGLCEQVEGTVFDVFYVPLLNFTKVKLRAFDEVCREHFDLDGETFARACCSADKLEWIKWFEQELKRLEIDGEEEHEKAPLSILKENLRTLFTHVSNEENNDE